MWHISYRNRNSKDVNGLNLISVGFLGVRFEVGEEVGEVKLPPSLKLVIIMSNVASKYTHINSFRKYTF